MKAKRFQRVGVLMGGPSTEREVSLRSGAAVARALRQAGYAEVAEIDVTSADLPLPAGLEAVFIALHGAFGEDGGVQQLLRDRGLPYTGSGPEASRLAFDKLLSKEVFVRAGIPTPATEVRRALEPRRSPLPVVVKPPRQGSSFGVHRVFAEADWPAALADAVSFDGEALVEPYIEGAELTVGIVGEQVLPVIQIRPPEGFYDFHSKYTRGCSEYLVPAPIPAAQAQTCQQLAWRAFQALGCRDLGRVDFRLTPAGACFALEMNTIPGFTETSLLPKAAAAAGLPFDTLCDRIMQMASVH